MLFIFRTAICYQNSNTDPEHEQGIFVLSVFKHLRASFHTHTLEAIGSGELVHNYGQIFQEW